MTLTRRVLVVVAALLLLGCGAKREPSGAPVGVSRQALALPLISPEIVFGRHGSVSDDWPDTAWSGSQFLVSWIDTRKSGALSLEATRVLTDGSELDSPPIRIASATGQPPHYALGADGSAFLATGQGGQRVLGDGSVAAAPTPLDPDVLAWTGVSYLAIWHEWLMPAEDCMVNPIPGALLGADGSQLGSFVVLDELNTSCAETQEAYVAYGSDVGLVSFDTWGGIGVKRVAPDGSVLDKNPIAVAQTQSGITGPFSALSRVAYGQGRFLVAWLGWVSPSSGSGPDDFSIRVGRVLPDGSLLDSYGGVIVTDSGVVKPGPPQVVWDGNDFIVVWYAAPDVRAARVGADGTVVDPGGFPVTSADRVGPIASDGAGHTLVTYQYGDATTNTWNVRARILGPTQPGPGPDAGAGDAASDALPGDGTVDAGDAVNAMPDGSGFDADAFTPDTGSSRGGAGGAGADGASNAAGGRAGSADAGADGAASARADVQGGCACRAASGPGDPRSALLGLLAVLAAVGRAASTRRSGT